MDVWLDVLLPLKRLSSKLWSSTTQFVHPFPRSDLCAGTACGSVLQNWPREKVSLEDTFQLTSAVWIWDKPSLCCFTFSNVTDELLF